MKRVFDILFSLIGLVALSPAIALVSLVIKVDSAGPILFKQKRVGVGGVTFDIFKFRTMRVTSAEVSPQITVGCDPRITKAGFFLRHWKLDEIPQLLNVVRGEMSFVGPRPEVPEYVALYPDHLRDIVLSVRPGITDPCSIALRSESDLLAAAEDPERFYVETLLPRKLQLASDYVTKRSMFSDIMIILHTIAVILGVSKQTASADLGKTAG